MEARLRSQTFLFLSTTDWDAPQFGSTLTRALAHPVITSPNPEKSRWLRDGETVFFVPTEDADALAQKIRYCRLHPTVAHCVGQAGRRLAQQVFDIAALRELLENLTRTWFGPQK